MFIQEVIIDGFKSYAQRTVISGFDPQFNAITGLNGTGKSNILDAICFNLGISNLSQVRPSIGHSRTIIIIIFRFEPEICKSWFTSKVRPELPKLQSQ